MQSCNYQGPVDGPPTPSRILQNPLSLIQMHHCLVEHLLAYALTPLGIQPLNFVVDLIYPKKIKPLW